MEKSLASKVQDGIQFLIDRGYRRDLRLIDTNALDMSDPSKCIIGQVFGDYSTGIDTLDLSVHIDAYDYGYNAPIRDMKRLKAVWVEELRYLDSYVANPRTPEPVAEQAKPAAVGMVNGNLVLRTGSGQHVVLPLNNDGYFNLDVLNSLANANK